MWEATSDVAKLLDEEYITGLVNLLFEIYISGVAN